MHFSSASSASSFLFSFVLSHPCSFLFFFTAPATPEIYTLSLHDALPIYRLFAIMRMRRSRIEWPWRTGSMFTRSFRARSKTPRSEEHTSELQSRRDLVCRLLLEKKKKNT